MPTSEGISFTLSHAVVLDGLRRAYHRQVVRFRHEAVFDGLARMGFIDWTRQPTRLSQQDSSARASAYHAPVEVAELTVTGHVALEWLTALERSPWWETLRALPYGRRPPARSA